ncbi:MULTISPECIES: AzlC family ABC transporter permease [unclassified Bradyrhizobium]|uniref:AzlC family ABC transporter permease n=1 Tax=unclassified Bradyrhizobium TaxID=2631580 RepID=UPI002916ACD9|nr:MULTISPECIES: AzlC family ABC transporter permease [unclassified Bradyrhizobium]
MSWLTGWSFCAVKGRSCSGAAAGAVTPPNTATGAFWRGAFDAIKLPAWLLGFSMMGIGPLARDVHSGLVEAALSTLLVFAGPAQVVYFGMLGTGAPLAAIAVAVTLSAVRFLPMTASLMPMLRAGNPSWGSLLLASHLVAVTIWVEANRRLPYIPPALRLSYFAGLGGTCLAISTIATTVGYVVAGSVSAAFAAGLLFGTPMFFTLTLLGGARDRAGWAALAGGFGLSPLLGLWLGPAAGLLLSGALGGSIAFAAERRLRGTT